jgi:hypothetical protein
MLTDARANVAGTGPTRSEAVRVLLNSEESFHLCFHILRKTTCTHALDLEQTFQGLSPQQCNRSLQRSRDQSDNPVQFYL